MGFELCRNSARRRTRARLSRALSLPTDPRLLPHDQPPPSPTGARVCSARCPQSADHLQRAASEALLPAPVGPVGAGCARLRWHRGVRRLRLPRGRPGGHGHAWLLLYWHGHRARRRHSEGCPAGTAAGVLVQAGGADTDSCCTPTGLHYTPGPLYELAHSPRPTRRPSDEYS